MAFTNAYSWLPAANVVTIFTAKTIDIAADTLNVSLYNAVTAGVTDATALYGGTQWGTEVTGTGWTGPLALPATLAFASSASVGTYGGVVFSAGNISVASTTISTAVYGCTIWDATISATAGPVLVVVYFGGTGYTTNNGTFGITWATSPVAGTIFTVATA